MGYTADFSGKFLATPCLDATQVAYINRFRLTRRMARNAEMAAAMPDPERLAVGLPIGDQAGYFVGGAGFAGQERDASILDYNRPPAGQPGLWCQWESTEDGVAINWGDGVDYVEWLEYLIEHFFQPWGITLSGEVKWQGEDMDDRGIIDIANNVIETRKLL